MKTSIYTNCSLVRVPIKAGETDYYLPQNVEWAGKKIDKLLIVAPQVPCTDPMDGVTPVMGISDLADCYITLNDSENREIMHDVLFENILHMNNNVIPVDAILNLSLCKISFTTAPLSDATLLLYAFYGTREEDYFDAPVRSMNFNFDLAANQEVSFRDIINFCIHAIPSTIKGIICWDAISHPVWISLRDHDLTYQMANIHSELCRPDSNAGTAYDSQAQIFYTNDLDIDFDYSHIREAAGIASSQRITFLY